MTAFDRMLLAEKVAAVERHLVRVESRLPEVPAQFTPGTDSSDAVILHLWQAVQIVIDLALAACIHFKLGTPASYAEAFRLLAVDGKLEKDLAERLVLAAGFRNAVAHAYERLDMERVYRAARNGPADLRAFLGALAGKLRS
jgi:uncharacterized protein YutE (UPF0331/DUF86 family)